MYVYLYDHFLRDRRFDATLQEMEIRLTDFGIAGKIIRLQAFSNSEAIVENALRDGATTIVIVGNDDTFARVLSRAAHLDTTFGFLPVGKEQNSIADVLGIPLGADAVDVLSRRRQLTLDLGWLNNRYFVSQLRIPPHDIEVLYDEQFMVSAQPGKKLALVVCNLQPLQDVGKDHPRLGIHPQDGKLEAFLRPLKKKQWFGKAVFEETSVFPFEEMIVQSGTPFVVEADGRQSKETRVRIRLAKNRLKMIVGKERQF